MPAGNSRGSLPISPSRRAEDADLHLLFVAGKRPDLPALRRFAATLPGLSISHAPASDRGIAEEPAWPGQPLWIELLSDGLTFDLAGLAPRPSCPFPVIEHRFDLSSLPGPASHEVLTLRPGPHLAPGGASMPVMRALLALGCHLVRQFEALEALAWGPARSAIGRRFFESVTAAWLDGGPFPALGLTSFVASIDGALETIGLDFWIGQELRIEPPLATDRVAATRLGIRLVNHLVLSGGLAEEARITAPDGTRLLLRPARQRGRISVWRE